MHGSPPIFTDPNKLHLPHGESLKALGPTFISTTLAVKDPAFALSAILLGLLSFLSELKIPFVLIVLHKPAARVP